MSSDGPVAEERRRIAERLHDGPVQQLTAAQLFIESALVQVPEEQRDPMLQRGVDALKEAITACRALMYELGGGDEGP